MSLAGLEMAFFLPLVLAVYWLMPRRAWLQNTVLLIASVVFYVTWSVKLFTVLAISMLVDYALGLYLQRTPDERPRARRAALIASIVFNVCLLGYFKYAGFFADTFNSMMSGVGLGASLPVLKLLLPLGISYYTLQKLGYILDIYYRRIEACRDLLRFATFVSFFAHITAGPITRAREMLPQYAQPRRLTPENVAHGGGLMLLGYTMKAYASTVLAQQIVIPVWSNPSSYGVGAHWAGLLGYTGQLFFDFAGYSLLAIGIGKLFGLQLPDNFNYPFLSRGMLEFWRRWHISLNLWLFDYLFGPWVTGRGFLRGKVSLTFLIVFLISGLWHGAQMTFVLWGLLHGVGLVVQHRWDEFYKGLCRKDRVWVSRRRSKPYQVGAWAITQLFFVLTLVPFAAPSIDVAGQYFAGLLVAQGSTPFGVDGLVDRTNVLAVILFFLVYHLFEIPPFSRVREALFALPAPVRGVAYGLAIVALAVLVPVGVGTFIYANF